MKSFIFLPELIQGFISGQKTQTRRLVKDANVSDSEFNKKEVIQYLINSHSEYKVGEVVYIREGFRFPEDFDHKKPSEIKASPIEFRLGGTINCVGDHIANPGKWRSPLHHPAKFARHFAKITDVRVERLSNISESDAKKEGIPAIDGSGDTFYKNYLNEEGVSSMFHFARNSFKSLWISIYGSGSFDKKVWVFVYSFVKCDKNGNMIYF
jgi:hypothetical protein